MSGDSEEWSTPEDYEIVRRIAYKKGSDLFQGVQVTGYRKCIIECFRLTREEWIKREIKVLKTLACGPNIPFLLDAVQDPLTGSPSLIFEYVENIDFRSLYPRFESNDIRYYIKELLEALSFCHSKGIMHRDVRPHNVMIDHQRRKLRLFGWDLAEFYVPGSEYSVRVSRGFIKAPELLLDYEHYDCSLDMWNVGVMLASMIFRKEPFFHGVSNFDLLEKIASVLGTQGLLNYIEMYDMESPLLLDDMRHYERRPWESFINSENQRLVDEDAIDLLNALLQWDHKERLTAARALQHIYFSPLEQIHT